ncbi:type VII secretion system-associated protein [Streptomyces sp. NPDC001514]
MSEREPQPGEAAPLDERDANAPGDANAPVPQEPPAEGEPGAAEEQPEWPEELVRMAKLAPDHIIQIVDPTWQGDGGMPPEWAVGGAWRTDSEGNIVEGEINKEYRPTPAALGWPVAIDPLDEAVQLSATGHITEDVVAREFAKAQLMVFVDEEGAPTVVQAPDGTDVVAVSSPTVDVDEDEHPHVRMPLPELLERTDERYDVYYLSPSAPVSVVVQVDALLTALAQGGGDEATAS